VWHADVAIFQVFSTSPEHVFSLIISHKSGGMPFFYGLISSL